jgi:hypothetical protein
MCKIWYSQTGHRFQLAHAHRLLDNWGYKYTLRIWNTYCFSTATLVTRTQLNVVYMFIACRVSMYRRETLRHHYQCTMFQHNVLTPSVTACLHPTGGWICCVVSYVYTWLTTSVSSWVGNPDDDTRQVSILHGSQPHLHSIKCLYCFVRRLASAVTG